MIFRDKTVFLQCRVHKDISMLSLDVFIKVEVVSSFHGLTADPAGGGGVGGGTTY